MKDWANPTKLIKKLQSTQSGQLDLINSIGPILFGQSFLDIKNILQVEFTIDYIQEPTNTLQDSLEDIMEIVIQTYLRFPN